MKYSLVSLIFLKRCLVFPILLFSSIPLFYFIFLLKDNCFTEFFCFLFPLFLCTVHLRIASLLFSGTLHSYEYIFPFLLCLSFFFFPQLFVKPPQTTILPFCISFSWGWFWLLPPVQCHKPTIHSSSGTLSEIIPWIYLSLLLYNCKGFDLGLSLMV